MRITSLLVACYLLTVARAVTWHQLNDKEYYIAVNDSTNFNGSLAACSELNATLAKVSNSTIQKFLMNFTVPNKGFYIGLKRIASGGEFRWLDGTTLMYTSWGRQQPDNGGNTFLDENCVTMGIFWSYNSLWYDIPCTTTFGYICQRTIVITNAKHTTTVNSVSSAKANTAAPTTSTTATTVLDKVTAISSAIQTNHVTSSPSTVTTNAIQTTTVDSVSFAKTFTTAPTNFTTASTVSAQNRPVKTESDHGLIIAVVVLVLLLLASVGINIFQLRRQKRFPKKKSEVVVESAYEVPIASTSHTKHVYVNTNGNKECSDDEEGGYVKPNPVFPVQGSEEKDPGYVEFRTQEQFNL